MIQSMTGYGRAETEVDGKKVTVEINSLNSRYLDIQIRLPKVYSHFDPDLKEVLTEKIKRGKIVANIAIEEDPELASARLELNRENAHMYKRVFETLQKEFELPGELEIKHFINLPDLIKPVETDLDEDFLKEMIIKSMSLALKELIRTRADEGTRLLKDIRKHVKTIETVIGEIENCASENIVKFRERLQTRMKELLGDISVSEDMIVAEAALVAERSDITEECVRIRSHIIMFQQACESDEPIGKKMNFILQELYREANTIGSKSLSADISRNVILLKEEIEKIREQVQNLE